MVILPAPAKTPAPDPGTKHPLTSANSLEGLIAMGMGDFVKRYLLLFVLAFVGTVSAVFTISALHAMNQLAQVEFRSQAASHAANMTIQIERLILRVKDAANYINSDMGAVQLTKVRNSVNGSDYVTDIGYLGTADNQRHSLQTSAPLAAAPEEVRRLTARRNSGPASPSWPAPTIIPACSRTNAATLWCSSRACRA